ncbi:MAG TPA: MFS transporter [Ktedonobacteraceae bacterium]|nr:MFS transporter [Ktedonobacteraceae bacterium]
MKILNKSLRQYLFVMNAVGTPSRDGVPTVLLKSFWQTNAVLIALTTCLALSMTSIGIFGPVVAKQLTQLGSSLSARSLITMAPFVVHLLLASVAGSFADRYGRRPLILLAFIGSVVVNVGYLFAHSVAIYVGIRFLQGVVSVGMQPAAMGILGDMVPEHKRTHWVGIIMAGTAAGFLIGPTLGGWLFDHWGFIAAYGVAALFNIAALLVVLKMIPETGGASTKDKYVSSDAQPLDVAQKYLPFTLRSPQWRLLVALLLLEFIMAFIMTLIEPQLMTYAYKNLLLKPTQYGLIISAFGLSSLIGQLTIGRISRYLNRKWSITLGFLLKSGFSFSLLFFKHAEFLLLGALLAGFGRALIGPTLSTLYLNMTSKRHHSRVIGIRESISSLGHIAGPLLAICIGPLLHAHGTFLLSGVIGVGGALLAFIIIDKGDKEAPVATSV